jgi:uncharacterized protein (DUF885 family)
MRTRSLFFASLFVSLSCRSVPTAPLESTFIPEDASVGVTDVGLFGLVSRYWAWQLEQRPIFATTIGVRAYDARIDDNSSIGIAAYRRGLAMFIEEARAIDAEGLPARDRTTLLLLLEDLEAEHGSAVCEFERWSLSPRGNPVTEWSYLPELHPLSGRADLEPLVRRVSAIGASIDNEAANLESGAKDGLFANRESTRRVIEIVEKQLRDKDEDWPLITNVKTVPEDAALLREAQSQILPLVRDGVRPALTRYLGVLRDTVLPGARSEAQSGVSALPHGAACYASQVRRHTSLQLPASEIHELGLIEIARIDEEIRSLGERLFQTKTLEETLSRLRSDPSLYFEDEAGVEEKAKAALAEAKAAMPRFFHTVPKTDCVVTRIPDYEAPYTTIAYYRPPIPGEKLGEYFINVHAPTTRPRYEAAALAYHEAIPGHHLQIAIAQELPALPAFRKHLGLNVFVEGWALYTERLADEMGLYASDLDRMGMLSYDAWRAARLVVDTGLHAFGWSRAQAKAFMHAHTALAANNIDNEVDRYIVWPGQALGYKLGQLEIWKLRRQAEQALGERFSLPLFHDAVLTQGAVSLEVLRAQVEAFISSNEGVKAP